MRTPLCRIASSAACVLILSVSVAADTAPPDKDHAQGTGRASGAVVALLDHLDAEDFGVREAASNRLRDDPAVSFDEIALAFARPRLSAEQSLRLTAALKERFASMPRPALGITLGVSAQDSRGIVITSVHKGFPATDTGLIRFLDIVQSLDGIDLGLEGQWTIEKENAARARMVSVIQSHDPGDLVPAVILRLKEPRPNLRDPGFQPQQAPTPVLDPAWERERLEVKLPLGNYASLPGAGGGLDQRSSMRYMAPRALEYRLARLGVALPGGPVVRAASKITRELMSLPRAALGWQQLAMVGGGREERWNPDMGRMWGMNQVFNLNKARMMRPPAGVQIPQEVRAMIAGAQGWAVAPGPGAAASGAGDTGDGTSAPASTVSPRAAEPLLRRYAEARSALESQETAAHNRDLPLPTQRAAQARAAELRAQLGELLSEMRSASPQGVPTVTIEGQPSDPDER